MARCFQTVTHALKCGRRATGRGYGVDGICVSCWTKRAVQGGLTGTLHLPDVSVEMDIGTKEITSLEKALTGWLKRAPLATADANKTRAPRTLQVTMIETEIKVLETVACDRKYVNFFRRIQNFCFHPLAAHEKLAPKSEKQVWTLQAFIQCLASNVESNME